MSGGSWESEGCPWLAAFALMRCVEELSLMIAKVVS